MATSYSPPHLSGTSEEKIVVKTEQLGNRPTLSTPRGEATSAAAPAQRLTRRLTQPLTQLLAQPITSNVAPLSQSRKRLHPIFRRAVSRHAKHRGYKMRHSRSSRSRSSRSRSSRSRSSRSRSSRSRSRPRRK